MFGNMFTAKNTFSKLSNSFKQIAETTSPRTANMYAQCSTPPRIWKSRPKIKPLKRRRTMELVKRPSHFMFLVNVAATVLKPPKYYVDSPSNNNQSPPEDESTFDSDSIIRRLDFTSVENSVEINTKDEWPSPNSEECFEALDESFENSNITSPEQEVELDTPTKDQVLQNGLDALPSKPQIVGQGGFGVVIKARRKGSNVAVKIIPKGRRRKQSIQLCLQGELNAIALNHPCIVRTLNIFGFENNNAMILMEFAGHRNLQKVLDDAKEVFTIQRLYKFSSHLISAINCCHSKNLAHLDVKPANIIVTCKDVCKLCDFGCSQHLDVCKKPHQSKFPMDGTVSYRAPELLRGMFPTLQADIYSYGITLWQMLSRELPFGNMEPHTIIYQVVACKHRPPLPRRGLQPGLSIYVNLYESCWKENPQDRPVAEDIENYVKDICKNI